MINVCFICGGGGFEFVFRGGDSNCFEEVMVFIRVGGRLAG